MTTEDTTPTTDATAAPEGAPAAAPAPEAAPGSNGAAEAPVDELLVGELLPQEMLNQTLMEIGHLEDQKAMKLAALDQMEGQGQQVIKDARTRLGLSEDVTLQVSPDGKMRRLPPQDNVVPMHPGQAPPAKG